MIASVGRVSVVVVVVDELIRLIVLFHFVLADENRFWYFYLVTSPLAFGYADDGFFADADTIRLGITPTSGLEDLILFFVFLTKHKKKIKINQHLIQIEISKIIRLPSIW